MVSVMWFRRDLRVIDQKALARVVASQTPTLCVFHFNPEQLAQKPTPNQSAFIQSVLTFKEELSHQGIELHLMYGSLEDCFGALAKQLPDWTDVYFNYDESGFGRQRDQRAARFFKEHHITVHAFQDHYLHGSQEITNQAGKPYKVFTPYFKAWQQLPKETPIPIQLSQGSWIELETPMEVLDQLSIYYEKNQSLTLTAKAAQKRLDAFIADGLSDYHERRDLPSEDGTSGLSLYLRSGIISIRTVYQAVVEAPVSQGQATFIKELAWRDFYNMIYVQHPNQKTQAIQEAFSQIEWDNQSSHFEAWKKGETGYPIVDAAMKQLQETGWMHNRLRMIVASFLTKDLLIDWRLGETYFQEMLIDYDAASNIGGWQWAASTGTDAVPYFRIFNPSTQSKRFDPEGLFIKTYLPQLSHVPKAFIHEPWKMPKAIQESSACFIGRDYPSPIVDHASQRLRAIATYEWAKEQSQQSAN
ncbi:cryptochrome/photolyase family protein [Streptococcus phocae subsp. phocae]